MKKTLSVLIVSLLIACTAKAQVDLNLGLRAYYPFSGNANDISGNNNNPVFNNATLTADRFGNPNSAYHFNGTNTYMRVTDNPTLNMGNKMSLAIWVKPTAYYTGPCYNSMCVMKSNPATLPSNYFIRFADVYTGCTAPSTAVERFAGNTAVATTPFVQLNQWYSVVWTSDGITEKIYVNCVLRSSVPAGGVPYTNVSDLLMGKNVDPSFPYWLDGDLDEVRIYDRALNQDEVNVLGDCVVPVACNNWLSTPTDPSPVIAGDIDVIGNQLTVEAVFNRTVPPPVPGSYGFLVSKHFNASDNNYALWPNGCALTTSTQPEAFAVANCDIDLNKTYHVAMVYDGTSLKFYRNGFLHDQTPMTGNLINNDLLTHIAINPPGGGSQYQFLGNMNEVRIWNVARTQAQIQTYMNSSLPNPTTTPGLLAYYTFDNLLNKQGNAAFNATLVGAAAINATNPNCTFVADSCAVTATSVIVNDYTPVLALNPCNNTLTVENGTAYNVGDTVLLIQMKGAVIDSTNTAAFGTITSYNNAGNYEFNYVKSKAGNVIELKNVLTRQYDIPVGKVQLIRVPYYINLTNTDTLTCLPWDGSKGGVLAVNVRDTLELNADINTSGKGFLKGIMHNSNFNGYTCGVTDYYYADNTIHAAGKGEGISFLSINRNSGKGPAANGGGGGMNTNSGGGGGSNGNIGGRGGYEWNGGCPNYLTSLNWGLPGKNLAYNNTSNKIFMGGAGGAGHCNNQYDDPAFNADYNGGNGGGIIIINTNYLKNNNKKIISKGDSAYQPVSSPTYVTHDGMGGGGSGGTVLINSNNYINNLTVDVTGGKGADLITDVTAVGNVGPGGGGGGGVVWLKQNSLPANIAVINNGGANGVIVQAGNNPYGAEPGLAGINVFSLNFPFTSVPFQKNIDSVRIKDSLLNCNGFDFKGRAYFNTTAIASWQWYFGDGNQANTQNTSHAYTVAGTYTVRLIVTDLNGCMDSTLINVNALPGVNSEAGSDTSICTNNAVSVTLHGVAVGGPYSWSPAVYLNNPNIQNPTATVSSTTTFYLNVTGAASCTSIDSVTIYINPLPLVDAIRDTAVCRFSPLVLSTVSNAVSYLWSPAIYVSDPTIANPTYIDNFSHKVYVTGTSAAGCTATDSVDVTVNPLPVVQTIPDTTVCINTGITLTTTGAQAYSWSPAAGLSNPAIASPVFNSNAGNTYTVVGTDARGCKNSDQVIVIISSPDSLKQPPAFTICQQQSVVLDGNNGNRVSYQWSPATYLSNATIINPVANPPQTTVYRLLVTDNKCGFDSLFTTILTVLPAPLVNVSKSNDLDCAYKSARLSASGGNQYVWSPATGLSSTTIPNPVATPANTQTYTVLVTDAAGCTNTASIKVFADNTASLARYMPNAFTPDGNGLNDCYGLKSWMYIKQLQFFIFNRYGEQVFATANPNTCWDGTYKGKPALAGTYVYVIKAQTDCGTEEQKGTFLLIR